MAEPQFATAESTRVVDPAATSACGGDTVAEPRTGNMAEALKESKSKNGEKENVLEELSSGEAEAPVVTTPAAEDSLDLLAGVEMSSDLTDEDRALLESPDFNVDTDDFSNIQEPHWLFETQNLFDRLKSLVIVVKDRQELVSKTIQMKPGKGYVIFRVNTGEIQVEVRVDTLNPTNPMEKDFVVGWRQFFEAVKASGSKLLFIERNNCPQITALQTDIALEAYDVDRAIFNHAEFGEDGNYTTVEGALFSRFLVRAQSSMALASRPEDRHVRVQEGTAFSSFLSSIYVQREVQIKDISFRASDLSFLFRMFEGAAEIKFKETPKNYVFATTWAKVVLPKIDTTAMSSVKKIIDSTKTKWEFVVSPLHLYKIANLHKGQIGNTGTTKCYNLEGHFTMTSRTRQGKDITTKLCTCPEDADYSVTIPLSALSSMAGMFKKEPVMNTVIDPDGRIIFSSEGAEVIFGSVGG